MSYYAVIKPKQDHLIKTNTRQVSLKVAPNTEVVSKEIHQPRATITYSDYNQGEKELQKNPQVDNNSYNVSHIISPYSRRIRGFQVQCLNGKIVNKKPNKIQVNLQTQDKYKKSQSIPLVQAHNSFQPVINQRQSDEFMFSLQPHSNSMQGVSPRILPSTTQIAHNNPITIQHQKQKTIIESIVSREQIVGRGGFIKIEKTDQILQKQEQQIISKQIEHYPIEENYGNAHLNVQNVKSPQKEKHRHPIFTNQNAEFFEESAVQSQSVPYPQKIKADYKYTPIQKIQSPKHHFTFNEPHYNGIQSKYSDKSFYLNNQNQM